MKYFYLIIILILASSPALALEKLTSFDTNNDTLYKISRPKFYSSYSSRLPWNNNNNINGMNGGENTLSESRDPYQSVSQPVYANTFQNTYKNTYKNSIQGYGINRKKAKKQTDLYE